MLLKRFRRICGLVRPAEGLPAVEALSRVPRPLDWSQRKTALLVDACRELASFHFRASAEVRRIYEGRSFDPLSIRRESDLERIPAIGSAAFKRFPLCSAAEDSVCTVNTSTGTGGARTSLRLDAASAERQVRMHRALMTQHGLAEARRVRYLSFIHEPRATGAEMSIAGHFAGLRALAPAEESFYCVERSGDDGLRLLKREALSKLEDFARSDVPVRVVGITAFIYETISALARPLRLPAGSRVVTGGGWKAAEDGRVSKERFREEIVRLLGVPEESVRDGYGIAEHGVHYLECARHRFHVPAYGRVIVRDPVTLAPLAPGRTGMLELLCPFSAGTPNLALLTTDLGSADPEACGCGLRSPTFSLAGRAGLVRHMGCALRMEEAVSRGGAPAQPLGPA